MEKTLMDEAIASSSITLVGALFFLMILKWVIMEFVLHMSSLRYALQLYIRFFHNFDLRSLGWDSQTEIVTEKANIYKKQDGEHENMRDLGDKRLCVYELGSVMEKLEHLCDHDVNGSKEIAAMFEEEPSLQEVKEAFHLFDENADGFIDAGEIKKVLCGLGFVASVSECERMIRAFDHNRDGRIDFEEFVKLMEESSAQWNCMSTITNCGGTEE